MLDMKYYNYGWKFSWTNSEDYFVPSTVTMFSDNYVKHAIFVLGLRSLKANPLENFQLYGTTLSVCLAFSILSLSLSLSFPICLSHFSLNVFALTLSLSLSLSHTRLSPLSSLYTFHICHLLVSIHQLSDKSHTHNHTHPPPLLVNHKQPLFVHFLSSFCNITSFYTCSLHLIFLC